MSKKITAQQLASAYFRWKEKLKQLTAQHDAEQKEIKDNIKLLETELAGALHEEGLEAVKVAEGTVGVRTKTVYKTDDLPMLRTYAIESNNEELLNMSLSVTGVKAYLEANGKLPPDVYTVEFEEMYNSPTRKR